MLPTNPRLRICLLLFVTVLAYGLCLASQYYMDDFYFVTDHDVDTPARWHITMGTHVLVDGGPQPTYPSTFHALLPALLITGHQKIFGTAPWLFHFWNLGLHFGCVLLGWRCFRGLLSRFRTEDAGNAELAYVAALVFACHPFCSEAINYAKCVYMQLVALTTLGAVGQFLSWQQSGRKGNLVGFVLWSLGAFTSYHYGFPNLAASIGLLGVILWGVAGIGRLRAWMAGSWHKKTFLFCLIGILLAAILHGWADVVQNLLASRYYPVVDHWMTQGRVFWMYLWRMVIPVQLCSDHHIQWSRGFGDWVAILSCVSLLAGLIWATWLAFSQKTTRWIGVASLLLVAPLLMRMLHVNPEVMVEYRAYPSMPWASLLLAAGILHVSRLISRGQIGQTLPKLVICVFVLLSAQRSAVWNSTEKLCRATLALYPLNNRPRVHLYAPYLTDQNRPAVEKLHTEALQAYQQILATKETDEAKARYYDYNRTDKNRFLEEVRYIDALALFTDPRYSPALWTDLEQRWGGYKSADATPTPAPMPWNYIYTQVRKKYLAPKLP
jgi:hypothetical protein